jgi:hypothetical protein
MRFAWLLLLAACSSSGGDGDTPPGTNNGENDGGTGADSEYPPPRTPNPFILTTGLYRNGGLTNLAFFNYLANPGERCEILTKGPCRIVECAREGVLPGGASAGDVTVVRKDGDVLTIRPNDDGSYPPDVQPRGVWLTRDTLKIKATGFYVPPFSQDVTAPDLIALATPAPVNGKIAIAKGKDLALTWTPGEGRAILVVNQTTPNDFYMSRRAYCDFDGNAGKGTVPGAALDSLETSRATSIDFGGATVADITPGGYTIRIYAIQAATFDATVN